MIKTKIEKSRAEDFWHNTLGIEFKPAWSDVWLFKLKGIKDNLLINFNFKFMYNILAIPTNLFKWKVNATQQCYYCNLPGDCIHMLFSCNTVIKFWQEVEKNIKKYFMTDFNFEPRYLLSGIHFNSKKRKDIDIILNYALFSIYKSFVGKEVKKKRTEQRLVHILFYLLNYRLQVEENISCRKPCITLQKWRQMLKM